MSKIKLAASAAVRAAKWVIPKIATGLKTFGRAASRGKTKFISGATQMASKGVSKLSGKLAASTTNTFVAKSLASATKILASEAILKPIITDLTYKGVKSVAGTIPVVGKPIKKVMDIGDAFIGIPLI